MPLPQGIYPALITPFRDGRFDRQGYARNLALLNETGLAGYLALGSNGEGVFLEDDEAVQVIETAAEHRRAGMALIAGTGRESTRRTVDLTRRAARAGAEAVLVVPPSYYRSAMTDSALEHHYRTVADASDVPVLLYHVPKFSPVSFSGKLILSLANHPNIAGIKETSGDVSLLSAVLGGRPRGFRVYVGTGSLMVTGFLLGCDGAINALSNVAPRECVQVWNSIQAGNQASAQRTQWTLDPVNHLVTVTYGVSGLKHAASLLEYSAGEPLRPLEPVSSKASEEIHAALVRANLLP